MRIPLSWLRDFVDWPWPAKELADRLTMAGVIIDTLHMVGEGIEGVIAARVVKVAPHPAEPSDSGLEGPDDDGRGRQWVVELDAGGRVCSVVAGIANMRPGDIVPYAPPGSVLPGDWRIGSARLHGVQSDGMVLSLSEFVLGEKPRESEGVLILPGDIQPGADLREVLGLPETTLELDLTPNYAAHCQSIIGVAREVAAQTGAGIAGLRLADPHALLRPSGPGAGETVEVTIEAPDLCPRYIARVIRGVRLRPSPWLVQFRILAAGMRPINNIVDATNYVMLEYGQPLHAFDLADISGRHIIVRRAGEGERITTLDGVERTLDAETLVIADEAGAVAVAGVMGGENSEVTPKVKDILLEAAVFDPTAVRRASTRLGIPSEAAARFDKGADPEAAEPASARAAAMIADLAGGKATPGSVDRNPRPCERREVRLRIGRVSSLLGVSLEGAEISSYLRLLGFSARPAAWEGASEAGDGLLPGDREADTTLIVTVPSWRTDVAEEVDLIEEVARLFGYDRIPLSLPRGSTTAGSRPLSSRMAERVARYMVARGYFENVGLTMVNPARDAVLRPPGAPEALVISNPLSGAMAAMRTGLLGTLVEAVVANLSHAERQVRLFETGTVYWPNSGDLGPANLPREKEFVSAVVLGPQVPSWREPGREPDFFEIKGLVEGLLEDLGVEGWSVARSSDARFHPGRQGAVVLVPPGEGAGGQVVEPVEVGVFGELHPRVLARYDLEERVMALELDLDLMGEASTSDVRAGDLPRFPAVSRDVAVILPDEIEAGSIASVIRESAGSSCAGVEMFDVYRGQPVPDGQRSTAWRVTYRASDRSLTDAEVDEAHDRVREALVTRLGAVLR